MLACYKSLAESHITQEVQDDCHNKRGRHHKLISPPQEEAPDAAVENLIMAAIKQQTWCQGALKLLQPAVPTRLTHDPGVETLLLVRQSPQAFFDLMCVWSTAAATYSTATMAVQHVESESMAILHPSDIIKHLEHRHNFRA